MTDIFADALSVRQFYRSLGSECLYRKYAQYLLRLHRAVVQPVDRVQFGLRSSSSSITSIAIYVQCRHDEMGRWVCSLN
jgi:hypothetical protein